MPKVSVCMPIYRSNLDYLKEAIESILKQTFNDFELLIANDNGFNDTILDNFIQNYMDKDSRIRYIKNGKNLGISKARNNLIKISKGEYIANMDHDDISLPTRIEKQVKLLDENQNIGVCGTSYKKIGTFFNNKSIVYPKNHKMIQASLCFKCTIHHPSVTFRRDVLEEHNISYNEDFLSVNDRKIFFDISLHSKLENIQEVLCLYRVHKQMTSKVKREKIKNEQRTFRRFLFDKLNLEYNEQEFYIFNKYIVNGRNNIKDKKTLVLIDRFLTKICEANRKEKLFGCKELEKLSAIYLIKRCFNAAVFSFISSKDILSNTKLPVKYIETPKLLAVVNFLKQ